MKHTPGPWKVGTAYHKYGDISVDVVQDGLTAEVAYIQGNGAEPEANARLIAGAPEMLEALKRILQIYRCDWVAMTPEEKSWANEYANSDEKCERLIKSAIRKAEEGL